MSNWKERLTSIFSIYIRLRDTNDYGYGNCITCGEQFHYFEFDCGHFRSRRHELTAWDELNAHTQCKYCNYGNKDAEYLTAMLRKYPDAEIPEKLIEKSKLPANYTDEDYEQLYHYYKNKVLDLLQDKMFIIKTLP